MSSPSVSQNRPHIDRTREPAKSIVRFDGVSFRYSAGPHILSEINLQLSPGSFTFLTGASGAGKSTLLKLLYMGLRPSAGNVSLFGRGIDQLSPKNARSLKRRIGVVSQDFGLIDHLDVFQNVALPLRVIGASRSEYSEDAVELLRWVGLGEALSALPPTLSGGERQRVAIARAVMSRPKLLIADEPTGNVDPAMGQRLLRLFTEMNRGGTTVVIATHDEGLMGGITADRLHIENGRLSKNLTA